jgi:DNA-binding GntR family transcriptional regulator
MSDHAKLHRRIKTTELSPPMSVDPLHVIPVVAPVRAQVVANLRAAILSGRFRPGERLVETTLCATLHVSRTSLREALRQLEAERLVTITPFKGPTVSVMTVAEAEEIYEVRELLEGHAAELFAARAKKQDIAAMRAALDKFEEAVKAEDAAGRIAFTDDFYQVLLQGCGNRVVVEMLDGLHARVNFLRFRSMSSPARASESLKEMQTMLAAIKAKAPKEAAQAARNHVRRARDAALTVLASS